MTELGPIIELTDNSDVGAGRSTFSRPGRLFEPLLFVVAGLAVVAFLLRLMVVPWVFVGVGAGLIAVMVRPRWDDLTVSGDGVDGRSWGRRVNIRWADVRSMVERRGLLHRRIVVATAGGRKVVLPLLRGRLRASAAFDAAVAELDERSQRAGGPAVVRAPRRWGMASVALPVVTLLLGLGAATVDRPFYWVSGFEAVSVPDTCTVVRSELAVAPPDSTIGPIDEPRPFASSCRLAPTKFSFVKLYYTGYSRDGRRSGAGVAHDVYARNLDHFRYLDETITIRLNIPPLTKEVGLGDDAFIQYLYDTSTIVARRANVLIRIQYRGTEAAGMAFAARAIAAIDLTYRPSFPDLGAQPSS